MKIRIGKKLNQQLSIVKENSISASGALRRAFRRYETMGKPNIENIELESTYNGAVVTIQNSNLNPIEAKKILTWYFTNWEAKNQSRKFTTNLQQGVDYIVEE